jgi:uncharacterized linocin/CFP29 family protein
MSCRVCGRSSCTESFHSFEEQRELEDNEEKYAKPIVERIHRRISRIYAIEVDGEYYYKCDDIDNIIQDEL